MPRLIHRRYSHPRYIVDSVFYFIEIILHIRIRNQLILDPAQRVYYGGVIFAAESTADLNQ